MAHQKSHAQIMAHSMLVLPLQIAALNGVSPMRSLVPTTHSPMGFAQSCVKIVKHTLQHAKYSGTNPRIALQHLKATPVDAKMPHPLRCCTTARYVPPYCLGSTILTQQPLQVQEHLEDWAEHAKSYADKGSKPLVPFYAGQPIATFDTWRKIWIPTTVVCVLPKNSYQVTANGAICHNTRCHLQGTQCKMQWCWAQGPISHIRMGSHQVSQTCATACHSHSINTTISCNCDPRTKSCCFSFYTYSHAKGHPSVYTQLNTECSTCATVKIMPHPHSNQIPGHGDVTEKVTAPGPMNDVLDPKCPWIMLSIWALKCWTISLAQAS